MGTCSIAFVISIINALEIYVALCLSNLFHGKEIRLMGRCSIAFVISTIDALEPGAAFPSLT
jgi:hypothetical protein